MTAVALSAALKADRCIIFTDVDGVYTADPNIVPAARRLDKISYEEMLEMASLGRQGAYRVDPSSLQRNFHVPVEVNSSFKEGKGTLVTHEDADMEGVMVSGVTGDRNQAKITIIGVPDHPGIAAKIFGPVAEASIVVDMIIQNVSQASLTDISFTVPRTDLRKAVDLVQRIAKEIEAKSVTVTESMAKVSLIGVGMRSHSGIAAKNVRHPLPRGCEHYDDQHVRDQNLLCRGRKIFGTGHAGASLGVWPGPVGIARSGIVRTRSGGHSRQAGAYPATLLTMGPKRSFRRFQSQIPPCRTSVREAPVRSPGDL